MRSPPVMCPGTKRSSFATGSRSCLGSSPPTRSIHRVQCRTHPTSFGTGPRLVTGFRPKRSGSMRRAVALLRTRRPETSPPFGLARARRSQPWRELPPTARRAHPVGARPEPSRPTRSDYTTCTAISGSGSGIGFPSSGYRILVTPRGMPSTPSGSKATVWAHGCFVGGRGSGRRRRLGPAPGSLMSSTRTTRTWTSDSASRPRWVPRRPTCRPPRRASNVQM